MMERFQEKVVLVTGASAGIGKTTLLRFAEEGAKVINAVIDEAVVAEVVNQVNTNGGDAVFVRTDVSDEDQVENLLAKIIEKYGRMDIAFNNAGIQEPNPGPIHTLTESDWQR